MKSDKLTTTTPELSVVPAELTTAEIKPTAKNRKAMAEARAFEKFGVHSLRVKSRVLAALGKDADLCGIKHMGHGKIILASNNAEEAIARLGKLADKMMKEKTPEYATILDIMRLQKEFNAQVIKTAEAHFDADKQPIINLPPPGGGMSVFPAGSAVMIAPAQAQQEKKIN